MTHVPYILIFQNIRGGGRMQSAPTHPCFPWFLASSLVSFTAAGSSTAKVREAADVNRSSTAGHEDAGPLCFVFTDTGSSTLRSFSCEFADTHLSKRVWRLPFLWVLYTRVCTHTPNPTLNLHGIVSELETQPAFDLHFPTLQDAEILTPSGLLVKTNPWETLARRCMVVHAVCV